MDDLSRRLDTQKNGGDNNIGESVLIQIIQRLKDLKEDQLYQYVQELHARYGLQNTQLEEIIQRRMGNNPYEEGDFDFREKLDVINQLTEISKRFKADRDPNLESKLVAEIIAFAKKIPGFDVQRIDLIP